MIGARKNALLLLVATLVGAALTFVASAIVKQRTGMPLSAYFGGSTERFALSSACVADQEEDIYFVSCGGTF